jgi:hypothetical protein
MTAVIDPARYSLDERWGPGNYPAVLTGVQAVGRPPAPPPSPHFPLTPQHSFFGRHPFCLLALGLGHVRPPGSM